MNLIKATVLIAAAAAVAVAGDHAFAASPFYERTSASPSYATGPTAAPKGYTTYCTPNGCYKIPVTGQGAPYVMPTSGNTVKEDPAGSPCANGACSIGSHSATPATAPIVRPNTPARTMPMTAKPKYSAPQASPFYSSAGTAAPLNPGTETRGPFMPAASTKTPSRAIVLAGNRPSPFYP